MKMKDPISIIMPLLGGIILLLFLIFAHVLSIYQIKSRIENNQIEIKNRNCNCNCDTSIKVNERP